MAARAKMQVDAEWVGGALYELKSGDNHALPTAPVEGLPNGDR
jgi:hypothetical protein